MRSRGGFLVVCVTWVMLTPRKAVGDQILLGHHGIEVLPSNRAGWGAGRRAPP